MLNTSKQTNPVKQAVLSAYNEAVYNIAVKYSFVVAQREDIRVPIDSPMYLLTIFEHRAFELEQVIKHYYQHIADYFIKFLTWRLATIWPLDQGDIEAVVELINFAHYDKHEFIFSPRNVNLLAEHVSQNITTYPPQQPIQKSFVIDPDFRGTEIGMDRDIGEVHDHTLLFCFIFLLIVVIIYLVATDNMLL